MNEVDDTETSQTVAETSAPADGKERRRQQRLRVNALAKLILPQTNRSISAMNQEISWGGGIFVTCEGMPPGVDSVLIDLPWIQGQKIAIHAHVLRVTSLAKDRDLVIVRFVSITPESHVRLERLLTTLGGTVQTAESKPSIGLFQELEVTIGDLDECHQILEQIADGRCVLRTVAGYDIGQSISLSIWGPKNMPEIRLRTRIVDVRKEEKKTRGGHDTYILTLDFEHPIEAITPLIDSLLSPFSHLRPSPKIKTPVAVDNGARAALEMALPGVLTDLTVVWGDHGAFEAFFLELLTVGGSSPGWPDEVWDELILLRAIHVSVFGAQGGCGDLVPLDP